MNIVLYYIHELNKGYMMNTTTASRALIKSKHLQTKIESDIQESASKFSFVSSQGKNLVDGTTEDASKIASDTSYQSIIDKINDLFAIRRGLNKVNANNTIKIDCLGKEMTILDALTYRLYAIPKLVTLRDTLKNSNIQSTRRYNLELDKASDLIAKLNVVDADSLNALRESHNPKLFSATEKIEKLNTIIDFFNEEFDSIMTEVNPSLIVEL